MIAGGIGITPIFANLKALALRGDTRPVILIYANKDFSGASFREELDALRTLLDITIVHILEDPPYDWDGEAGFIDEKMLARNLPPQSRTWPHLMCGPAPMLDAARKALRARGVPLMEIETEVFDLV